MDHAERGKPVSFSIIDGVVLPGGRRMGVQVEDAGESECPAVMVGIGVPTLPHPKGEPTSYAGVAGCVRQGKL